MSETTSTLETDDGQRPFADRWLPEARRFARS